MKGQDEVEAVYEEFRGLAGGDQAREDELARRLAALPAFRADYGGLSDDELVEEAREMLGRACEE